MLRTAPFGRTGHRSSRVVFGAAALSRADRETADGVLEVLDRYGVNHIDTAAAYGDAELRVAPWLRGRRGEFFLATKTGERTADGARASLERSLERLGVDRVDLIQLHNLVEEEEWKQAHGPGGALEAMIKARDEGLASHIGLTGHGLRIVGMHLRALERFDYDSVLFPYNHSLLAQPSYRDQVERLLDLAAERGVAVQTIKSVARRRWGPDAPRGRRSWYEPLDDPEAIGRAVRFVLSRPGVFLCSSSDYRVLPAILEAAAAEGPEPSEEELLGDEQRLGVEPLFDGGQLERI